MMRGSVYSVGRNGLDNILKAKTFKFIQDKVANGILKEIQNRPVNGLKSGAFQAEWAVFRKYMRAWCLGNEKSGP